MVDKKSLNNLLATGAALVVLAMPYTANAGNKDRFAINNTTGNVVQLNYPMFGSMWSARVGSVDYMLDNLRTSSPSAYNAIREYLGNSRDFSKMDLDNNGYTTLSEINQSLSGLELKESEFTKLLEKAARGSNGSSSGGASSGSSGGSSSGGSTGGSTGGNSGGRD